MKKILLGATALSVVGLAGAANAQEWSARVGGFMTLGVGYVDSDAHKAEVEIVNNSEVIFNFRLVADNGLTFGAKAEIENNGGPTTSDEYVGWVEGSFGRVEVGAEDGAYDRLRGFAAGGTAFTAAGGETGLLFDYAAGESPANAAAIAGYGNDTGDDLKITYFTPRIAGFQAGVSYANAREGGTSTNGAKGDNEAFEFGANYQNTFGGFSVLLGGGYVSFSSPQQARFGGLQGDDTWSVTANVGFAGFTVGGMYKESSYKDSGVDSDEAFAVGANYATGPWLFGIQYAQAVGGRFDGDFGVSGGVDYALAPGVTVGGIVEYAEADSGDDAWATGIFMNLGF